jgi:hypothetical protein
VLRTLLKTGLELIDGSDASREELVREFQAIETHGDAGKFGERVWRTIADRRTRAAAPDSTSAD